MNATTCAPAVATAQRKVPERSSLIRTMRAGDELTIDNGRIVIRVDLVDRKRGTIRFLLSPEVVVDKPPKKPPA